MRNALLATAALLSLATVPALAETTVITRDRPADVVVDRSTTESKTVTERDHGDGCTSKTVSKENDLGDRKTVTKESCD